jgi:hypothetical protein
MGPLGPYVWNFWNYRAFQASNTFNVAPGTYTVYVKDRNGCVYRNKGATVAQHSTAAAAVAKNCTATNAISEAAQ